MHDVCVTRALFQCLDSNGVMDAAKFRKWNEFYEETNRSGKIPPWESTKPFEGLVRVMEGLFTTRPDKLGSGSTCIELGCGCSASAVYLSTIMKCSAVDISPVALERAKNTFPKSEVDWIVGDLLDPELVKSLGAFDVVFDMQCFHVLRDIDEHRATDAICTLLRSDGYAIVVAGAESEEEPTLEPGPPRLTRDEVTVPFLTKGLDLISLEMSRFNATPYYSTLPDPPLCWIAVFHKRQDV